MEILADKSLEELRELMWENDQPAYRAKSLFKWLSLGCEYDEMTDMPKTLLDALSRKYVARALTIRQHFRSQDGSVKFLYELSDGNLIEGIYMPHSYGDTLCVSTQVGCRMGCAFCASGIGGLVRNLTAGEILGQVIAANRFAGGNRYKRAITNIVLMGSGEPLDNYDNVTKFFDLVSCDAGLNISLRNISLSTCGIVENIRRLADSGYGVTLSISLHATVDEARRQLMPIANKYTIAQLIEAVKYYFDRTGRRIIFEYSLVKDKNMNYFDAKRLRDLTRGYPSHVNLIMLNRVEEKDVKGCTRQEAERFLKRLTDMGISATIRHSFGNDVGGACGQLRRKFIND